MSDLGPSAHAILGGSVAERWINCDAYKRSVQHLPESPPNQYTVEGSALHALTEVCLDKGFSPHNYLGKRWLKEEPGFTGTYTEEQIEAVSACINAVCEVYDPMDGDSLYLEKEIAISSIDKELHGSADIIIWKNAESRMIVMDHKFGKGKIVDPKDNPQGAFYLCGAVDTLGLIPKSLSFAVIQPRISKEAQWWHLRWNDLIEWRGVFRRAHAKNNRDDAQPTAGAHCHWCRAAGTCKALAEKRRLSVRADFAASINGPVSPAALTLEQRGNLLRIFPQVEEWIEAVRTQAHIDALAGKVPEGFHVTAGKKGNREWIDEEKAKAILEATLGDEAYSRKLLTPAQAEKAMGKGVIDALVTQAPGKPMLTPISDGKNDYSKLESAKADFLT